MQIRTYQSQDEAAVLELWKRSGITRPWNDPRKDIDRKLRVQPELFFVTVVDEKVVGTIMAGYDGHRGWFHYLAVDPDLQKRGHGRRLIDHAERALGQLGCPKINVQVRRSNASAFEFYRRVGYLPDDVESFGKRLVDDGGGSSDRR